MNVKHRASPFVRNHFSLAELWLITIILPAFSTQTHLPHGYHRTMRQRTNRSLTRRILRSRPLWLLLAIANTITTTVAGIYLFGRLTELQEASSEPVPWQQFATETTIRHWTGITLLCEIAALVCWLIFARAWSRRRSAHRALPYIISIAVAILGPGLLATIFALL
jgi:hypothetical protein